MYVNAGKVYVFRSSNGSVKVGCSKDVEKRKNTIEHISGAKITEFWSTADCSNYYRVEKEAHKAMKRYRTVGEWFDCDFQLAVSTVSKAFDSFAEFSFISDEESKKFAQESFEGLKYMLHFDLEICAEKILPANMLDLDSWNPTEEDTQDILSFLMDAYLCNLEYADEDAAQEYINLYNKVEKEGIVSCKEDVQGIFCDCFWAVDGEIEKYYSNNEDILRLMSLTILRHPVTR